MIFDYRLDLVVDCEYAPLWCLCRGDEDYWPPLPGLNILSAASDGFVVVVLFPQKEDSDKIGLLQYFPPNGTFNLMYYPYYGKKAQVSEGFNESSAQQ